MTTEVKEGLIKIGDTVYCDTCWDLRDPAVFEMSPKEQKKNPCVCEVEEDRICSVCTIDRGIPCYSCYPDRHAAWTIAMNQLDDLLLTPTAEDEAEVQREQEAYARFGGDTCFTCMRAYNDVSLAQPKPPCPDCSPQFCQEWNAKHLKK
jgi:hypothetical protein